MFRPIAVAVLSLILAAPLMAATRMTYEIHGTPTAIEWASSAFPLKYEIEQRLAAVNPSATAMIDRAFAAWTEIPGTDVRFQSEGVVNGTAARAADRVAVSLAGDLFAGQGAVAVTTYTYDVDTGRMLDADISVDPSLFDGSMNAQMALQHEVGHVLGLDHSAVLSSIMYPFVGAGGEPADFETDDSIAITNIYPKGDPTLTGATLSGRVTGDDGGIFAAQVVAVNATGQPVGSVLTNPAGEFSLAGIPAGRYRLYAEPLDGPMEPGSLQGTWARASAKSFPTAFFSSPVDVENGKVYGNLMLSTAGAVTLNPRWIGVTPAGRTDVTLSGSPATVRPGETVMITVAGDGFTSGMTEFDVISPSFKRISDYTWAGNYVQASYAVDGAAPGTSAVVVVRSGHETATLTGALRVYRASGRSRSVRK